MKEFFANKHVQRSLMMIDWDTRPITLLDPTGSDGGTVAVTRELQVQALLPHTLVDNSGSGLDGVSTEGHEHFTLAQAAIRDSYDAFLDGLERFASYAETHLVEVDDLKP